MPKVVKQQREMPQDEVLQRKVDDMMQGMRPGVEPASPDKRADVLAKVSSLADSTGFDVRKVRSVVKDIVSVERTSERTRWWRRSAREKSAGKSALQTEYEARVLENPETVRDFMEKSRQTGVPVKELYRHLRSQAVDTAHARALAAESGPIVTLDVGGTGIKYALYDQQEKNFSGEGTVFTPQATGDKVTDKETFIKSICDTIEKVAEDSGKSLDELGGVGVLVPASVDMKTGNIPWLPFIGIRDVNLKDEIYDRLGLNASVGHDTTGQTLGAAKELEEAGELKGTVLGVAAGTAVGMGVVMKSDEGYRLMPSPDLGFKTELFRGPGVGRSLGVHIETPDHNLGWKVAGRGIVNTVAARLNEVSETSLLKEHTLQELSELGRESPDQLYAVIRAASEKGDALPRRIMLESLDTDAGMQLAGNEQRDYVNQRTLSFIKGVQDSGLSRMNMDEVTPLKVDELARGGDVFSKEVLEEAGYFMGAGLSTMTPVINPDKVVLMGGISNSDVWREKVESTVRENTGFEGEILAKGQETMFKGAAALVELDLKHRSGSIVA